MARTITLNDLLNRNSKMVSIRKHEVDVNNLLKRNKFCWKQVVLLCTALRTGHFLSTASLLAGISQISLKKWMKLGQEYIRTTEEGLRRNPKHARYALLVEKVNQAIAESENTDLQKINKVGETQWQATAWKLERRHRKKWNNPTKHEITSQVQHNHLVLDVEKLNLPIEVERALLKAIKEKGDETIETGKLLPTPKSEKDEQEIEVLDADDPRIPKEMQE